LRRHFQATRLRLEDGLKAGFGRLDGHLSSLDGRRRFARGHEVAFDCPGPQRNQRQAAQRDEDPLHVDQLRL